MIWEVVANALDEHLAGRCTRVDLELAADGSIGVDDDGAGMPVHEVDGIPFAERVLTTYHDEPTSDGHAPHEHVGLHGVGVFVVCALSTWLELDVFRDGSHYAQRFERGRPVSPLGVLEPTNRKGTRVRFLPDPTIFSSTWVDPGPVVSRLKEMSYLLPGLAFSFVDRREHRFHEPDGLAAYVRSRMRPEPLAPLLQVRGTVDDVSVEAAAGWGPLPWASIESFANIDRTTDGGTHVRGFMLGLTTGLQQVASEACAGVPIEQIEAAVSRGLVAIVCVRLVDPTYGAPTKSRLETPEAKTAVEDRVASAFAEFLEANPAMQQRLLSDLADLS
jgi:DNA gyrase subunit B